MPKTIPRFLLVVVFVIGAQACVPTGAGTPDANAIATAIIQTLTALPTTSEPVIPVTGAETSTPVATITARPAPTDTIVAPTETQAASPIPLVTSTSTATAISGVQVRVSVATNCRVGPGTAYERVGVLRVGEAAEVVGRGADGEYWIIRNPDRAGQTCWLWDEFARLEGDTSTLPPMTPPVRPTPAAGFDVFYDGLERCTDTGWWVEVNVENLGALTFRSITLEVEDRDTGDDFTVRTDGFRNNDGCDESEVRATLLPRTSVIMSSPVFNYDPTGHRLRVTVTLCSEVGRTGTCITDTVNLRP